MELTSTLLFCFFSDPLGIVVYNDLPDGATCFNRTLARESARSCPATATNSGSATGNMASMANSAITVTAPSKSSMMASAKTLQNHTKAGASTATSVAASVAASRTMALRPTTTQSTTTRQPPPTNLRPQHNSRSTDNFLVYETVDKPAQVGRNLYLFIFWPYNFFWG